MHLVALALEWTRLNEALKEAKRLEAEKRAELVAACFPAGLELGTNKRELEGGYLVKAVVKSNAKVLLVDKLKSGVAKLVALGAAGELLAERLVKWKPEVSVSEWKKLTPQQQRLFKDAVSLEGAAPSVEVTAPA